jgi:hypothetical protein
LHLKRIGQSSRRCCCASGAPAFKGKTIGLDATTLEANAAMCSIVRRDTGDNYEESLS